MNYRFRGFELTAEDWEMLKRFWIDMENWSFFQHDLGKCLAEGSFYKVVKRTRVHASEMVAKKRAGMRGF